MIVKNAKCDWVNPEFLFYGFPTMSWLQVSGIEYQVLLFVLSNVWVIHRDQTIIWFFK